MQHHLAKYLSNPQLIFKLLLSADILMLLLHLFWGGGNGFFHLDVEYNLPTVYQSFKLIIFGLTFFYFGLTRLVRYELKSFVLPLSLFLVFLGFDELLQIHENIYRLFEFFPWFHPSRIVDASMKMGYRSSLWILYYLPLIFIFVFWSGYWLRYFQSKMKSNFWIILVSSLSLFIIILAEILSSTGSYSDQIYFWMVTVEEFAEMILATTLILVGSKVILPSR